MRIFASSTPSSAAAICASGVLMPCPRSTLPLAIETVPSRSKCTRCVRRRASESGRWLSTGLFTGFLHRTHDAFVRAAAAQVLVERLADFVLAGRLVAFQQCSGGDGDAAHAIAALCGLLGDQRPLHRVQVAILAQALDGRDLLALHRPDRQVAGRDRPAVEQHEARAALAAAAAEAAADE